MSDYASRQRNPRKHAVGLTVVVLFHVLLAWAVNSGLAKKFVKVVRGPVEAQLLEEAKPDIPPPPPPPPPRDAPPPPPPAYVPPAEVVNTDAPSTNAIAAVSTAPPTVAAPPVVAPPVAAAPPPPPPPPVANVRTPPVINAAQNCEKPSYPAASRRAEEEGTVQLRFLVDVDGRVIDSQVEVSSGFKRLDEAARAAMSRCQFKPGTHNGQPEQSWASMKYTWRLE